MYKYEPPPVIGMIVRALDGTKVDPNALESAAPTNQGALSRLTVKNHTIVGSTMDQALTYSTPIVDLLGNPSVTLGYRDLLNFFLVAGETPPTDLRIWIGASEGVVDATHKGMAIGLGYSAGQWLLYRAANVAGASWAAASAAAAQSASTMAAKLTAQFGASGATATVAGTILDSSLQAINLSNGSLSAAMALSAPAFTHVFLGVDWVTGAGGSEGETIDLKGISASLAVTSIPNIS